MGLMGQVQMQTPESLAAVTRTRRLLQMERIQKEWN